MKRPEKKALLPKTMDEQIEFGYRESDIDPLLDELEALRNAEPFPSLEEVSKYFKGDGVFHQITDVYNYFAKFKTRTIEVMPEVGKEYEFKNGDFWCRKVFDGFMSTDEWICKTIRPISTPNRDEVIAKAKELGLTDSELEVLCNTK